VRHPKLKDYILDVYSRIPYEDERYIFDTLLDNAQNTAIYEDEPDLLEALKLVMSEFVLIQDVTQFQEQYEKFVKDVEALSEEYLSRD